MSVDFPEMISFRLVGAGLCMPIFSRNYTVLVKLAFPSISSVNLAHTF